MRLCVFVFFIVGYWLPAIAAPVPELASTAKIHVLFPEQNPVIFVGKKAADNAARAGGGMMYPGDTAGVFLVSILTHAAVNGAAMSAAEKKAQDAANQVLAPFGDFIKEIDLKFLWDEQKIKAIESKVRDVSFSTAGVPAENDWSLGAQPVFALTQSKASLILYNKITLAAFSGVKPKRERSQTKKKSTKDDGLTIVVVSDPITEENKTDYWLNNSGSIFKSETKNLFAISVGLAIKSVAEGAAISTAPEVSIRYLQDGLKHLERGQIITQDCKRTVFRTLGNELKSVPNLEFASCPKV